MSNDLNKQGEYSISSEKMIVEQIRSIKDYEKALFKCAILLNGAAAISVLAFIGSIWTIKPVQPIVVGLNKPLLYFSIGLIHAALSLITGYFTSIASFFSVRKATSKGKKEKDVNSTNFMVVPIKAKGNTIILYVITFIFLFTSYGAFIFGIFVAIHEFIEHYHIVLDIEDVNG